ncbi:UbiA family prenyltransferase [Yinghuangia sp. YIM S09857]|uniref:UbiA family prenyltransferase n=1 Tax=Yinghuangia sp. YIM S09857 TaxID=3436929 RepID=UPI003F53ADCF
MAEALRDAGTGVAAATPASAARSGSAARRVAANCLALARACHPLPTAAVTTMVTAVAAGAGRGAAGSAGVGAAVLAGQLSVGWCNDAADARRDAAAGRTDKPAATGELPPRALGVAAGAALTACVPLSLLGGREAAAAHLTGVLLGGWAYDFGLKRTVLSPLPYAVGFGVLPAFVTLGLPGAPRPAWWATAGAALLGVGAHLVNVLPDLDADRATGVRGLPHRLGAARVRRIAPAVLLAAVGTMALGSEGPARPADWAVLGAAAATAALGTGVPDADSPVPFRAAVGVAGLTVVLLVSRADTLT